MGKRTGGCGLIVRVSIPVRLPLTVPLLVLAACAEARPPEAAVYLERDSASIRIIENRVDTATIRSGWSVQEPPLLTIGGVDAPDEQQVFGLSGARRLADGRIAIVDRSATVRVFGADGTLVASHGRQGEGPGEFVSPALAGVLWTDSLVVFDGQLRRVSIVHTDSGFARLYAIATESGGFPVPQGMMADGGILVGGGMFFSSDRGFPTGLVRPTSRYVVLDAQGAQRSDLGEIPAAEMFARTDGSRFTAIRAPFGRVTGAVAGDDGFWIGTGDAWEVRRYGEDATLQGITRLDIARRPVTAALREAHTAEAVADAQNENEARDLRTTLAEIPSPALVPPYEVFVADTGGSVWIGEYLLPGETRRTFTVVNRAGHVVGRVTMPDRTLPFHIGPDWLLGRSVDELDVERVTLWQLARGRPR
ncbi:MAG: hypothetical protein L0271_20615 [Gemmatimonadetes bacterium]|nr:hypothetical protein [Gemmatimonadota bacterium]